MTYKELLNKLSNLTEELNQEIVVVDHQASYKDVLSGRYYDTGKILDVEFEPGSGRLVLKYQNPSP